MIKQYLTANQTRVSQY